MLRSNLSTAEWPAVPGPMTADVYRQAVESDDLVAARVRVKQTDMLVSASVDLGERAETLVNRFRHQIEDYIVAHPNFAASLAPLERDPAAPAVVGAMISAGATAGVGPMAAVAGAIAEFVGTELLPYSRDVIVENGGDIFIRSEVPREVLLLVENTEFEGLRIAVPPSPKPFGIGTSSGTTGPSLSLGGTDAVMAVAPSASLADAAATAVANVVKGPGDLADGIARARQIGVDGVVVVTGQRIAAWGRIQLVG
jgi:uncharacterized protein